MDITATHDSLMEFILALALTQPRVLAMFAVLPLLSQQTVPGLLRQALASVIGLAAVPIVLPQIQGVEISAGMLILLIAKEAFIGFVIGYVAAIPFWIFEAVGFLIDNQRGASIASTLNPMSGNDSSPLGIMFNQAFVVYFLISGGFLGLLGVLYDSFSLWSTTQWFPTFSPGTVQQVLGLLDRLMSTAILFAAPALVAMFLAELGLALVSRFTPQLQVFFVAMPIKSAVAMLVLLLYAATLFEYGSGLVESTGSMMPFLQRLWGQ